MDKVLAFSILSASPADIAAGGYWARLSWRRKADDQAVDGRRQPSEQQQRGEGSSPSQREERRRPREAPPLPPRFAPEFDGIDCFETIVMH
ncbi:Os06g0133500 [Oryza sativa Japonica Group]|jgi:hypothetical protein|uniref:Os06g0133500 protein n=6 Tax=Oryza TaxID=4527 RepID=Q0DEV0_ORYSJ|nr:uncharacterized protein LOC127775897 [Oryza glaberrima]AAO33152.1 unknown [Oryza sativa Japonica Group]ACD93452.1 unknown [Oryza sativa Indica Group]KAB8101078.1 hypothetical protein EE612_031750 [Oryza sativa]EAY99535.1 hypothetical protein OsI_21504 [Oryza sativa Indica Group]EAZ35726.1 hypothetical protein OsJ_20017 [Oryza sativa Japonica Group]|eukprot:NP_001056709.1 Os06g0133500 [Oryza sativa Japonica Group]